MPTPTYDLIASNVLSSSASSVTFSSIPATYRDLVLVVDAIGSGSTYAYLTINSDSGANYNRVYMGGDGSSAFSAASSGANRINSFNLSTTTRSLAKYEFLDYSAADKHKSLLFRENESGFVMAYAARWASTSAINTLAIATNSSSFASGSTFYLYGIVS